MRHIQPLARLAILIAITSLAGIGHAQVPSTASQQLQLSAFAGGTGTFTNLDGGKNVDITAGADLTYLGLRFVRPSLEVRGSYPVDKGTISSQKSFLGGLKVEHAFGRLHPYVDFLIGRGEIDYGQGGYPVGDILYISSTSTVYSPGGGLDYNFTRQIDLKADLQYQHWDAPVVSSGVIHPVAVTLGAVYRFDFNPRHHRSR
jgi:opacity protein-like surface antigen